MSKNLSGVEWDAIMNKLAEHEKKLEQLLEIMNELKEENSRLRELTKLELNTRYGGGLKIYT